MDKEQTEVVESQIDTLVEDVTEIISSILELYLTENGEELEVVRVS